jgi:hypothetical protein
MSEKVVLSGRSNPYVPAMTGIRGGGNEPVIGMIVRKIDPSLEHSLYRKGIPISSKA